MKIRNLFFAMVCCLAATGVHAESHRIAVAPLTARGGITYAQKSILANGLNTLLSASFEMVTAGDYRSAEQAAKKEAGEPACNEIPCLERIRKLLNVGRLFFVEIVREGERDRIRVSLLREGGPETQEGECLRCGLVALRRKLKELASRLVKPDTRAEAKPQGQVKTVPGTGATPRRVVISPPLYTGEYGSHLEVQPLGVPVTLLHFVRAYFGGAIQVYTVGTRQARRIGRGAAYYRKRAWSGFFSKSPDPGFLQKEAAALGADLIFLHQSAKERGYGETTIYLYHAESNKLFEEGSAWDQRNPNFRKKFPKIVRGLASSLLKKALAK